MTRPPRDPTQDTAICHHDNPGHSDHSSGNGLYSRVSIPRNARKRNAVAYFLTQLAQATQRPKRKDRSGVYSCVASVAFLALRFLRSLRLRALRLMETGLKSHRSRRLQVDFNQNQQKKRLRSINHHAMIKNIRQTKYDNHKAQRHAHSLNAAAVDEVTALA